MSKNGLKKTPDNDYVATGKLTICGVEKDQAVDVFFKGKKETKKGNIFGIEVILEVDRTRFGLDWRRPRLGDQITLVGHLLYQEEKE
jgi:polyisoprenoid-binding protein YceI